MHQQTESSRLSVALVSDQVTEKDYFDYLVRMKDIVAYYEDVVFSGLSTLIPDIEQRRKLHLLQNDLSGYEKDEKQFSLPPAESTAVLLGYMYVLEGSSLGGVMIARHVSQHINVPTAFFNCYGKDLSARWKSFLDIIGEYSLEEKNAAEMIAGARIAFKHIYEHLSLL